MTRLPVLVAVALLAATVIAVAPSAEAAPRCWYTPVEDKVECLTDICVYGYATDCLIYNPCNPWYCDPWLP